MNLVVRVLFVVISVSAILDPVHDLRSSIRKRFQPLLNCKTSSVPLSKQIPPRPTCPSREVPRQKRVEIHAQLWKLDLSVWKIQGCECYSVQTTYRCQTSLFDTPMQQRIQEFIPMSKTVCKEMCTGRAGLRQSEHPGVLEAGTEGAYVCPWWGHRDVINVRNYTIETQLIVDHVTKKISAGTSFAAECDVNQGECPTSRGGWVNWEPKNFSGHPSCGLIPYWNEVCSIIKGDIIIINCALSRQILHFKKVGNPVTKCETRNRNEQVLKSVEGIWISGVTPVGTKLSSLLSDGNSNHVTAVFNKMMPLDRLESLYAMTTAQIEWVEETFVALSESQRNTLEHEICVEKQMSWDIAWRLRLIDPEGAAIAWLNDPALRGTVFSGSILYWRCAEITDYRFIFGSTPCTENFPIEYATGISTMRAYVTPITFEIVPSPGRSDCHLFRGFLVPINSTHSVDISQNVTIPTLSSLFSVNIQSVDTRHFMTPTVYTLADLRAEPQWKYHLESTMDAVKKITGFDLTDTSNGMVHLDSVKPVPVSSSIVGYVFGPTLEKTINSITSLTVIVVVLLGIGYFVPFCSALRCLCSQKCWRCRSLNTHGRSSHKCKSSFKVVEESDSL